MIVNNSAKRQDNVLIEYPKHVTVIFLYYIFDFMRCECALLRNRLDKTPVVPVFVAERENESFKPVSRSVADFSTNMHARSENGIRMISNLR